MVKNLKTNLKNKIQSVFHQHFKLKIIYFFNKFSFRNDRQFG